MKICLYGASSTELDARYLDAAYDLGRRIAAGGHTMVYGGGAQGVMGAAARGVVDGGGKLVGIAPTFFRDAHGVLFDGCTEFVYTETMAERKTIMMQRADAFVMAPGGIGTYEEFFEMLTLKQLGRTDRAIVIVNTNGYYEPMQRLLEHTAQTHFMSHNCLELYKLVDTPEQALDYINSYVPQSGSIRRLSDYNK